MSADAAHTFVVPAFGRPEWLERCLRSLLAQTTQSQVLITTSTPNDYLARAASNHGVSLIVNSSARGIASDWNFAYAQAHTAWVTLAHQDDTYSVQYVTRCLEAASGAANPIMVFTAAHESFEPGGPLVTNARVKRLIAGAVFMRRRAIEDSLSKRLLLSVGNPIPCPTVMLHRQSLTRFRFPEGWNSNLDWKAWRDLAREPGAFVYVRLRLVERTLHANAATTQHLAARIDEDRKMLADIWPAPVAWALTRLYAGSRRPYVRMRAVSDDRSLER